MPDAGATPYSNTPPSTPPPETAGDQISKYALQFKGTKYVSGGQTPAGFDCGGLVGYVYTNASTVKDFPSIGAPYQWYYGRSRGTVISDLSQLKPGDIVYIFKDGETPNGSEGSWEQGPSHTGIYIGNGKIVHAPKQDDIVKETDLSAWSQYTIRGVRLVEGGVRSHAAGNNPSNPAQTGTYTPSPVGLEGGLQLTEEEGYYQQVQSALKSIDQMGYKKGYIVDLNTGHSLQYIIPESTSDSNPAMYDTDMIPGRSTPVIGYNSSGPRTISIQIELFASLEQSDNGTAEKNVEDKVAFLRSLTFPDYSKYFISPPSPVLVVNGRSLKVKAVITDVQVEWKAPFDEDGRHMAATVNLTLQTFRDIPFDRDMVRNKKDVG